ncbi:MAG: aldose epimerase family protein [Planctomycetota bacterium]|jgi:aldose 1-epimerase
MSVITINSTNSASTARICVDRGFNCIDFQAETGDGRSVDVIDSEPGFESGSGRVSGNGIPLLFPFPNRIRGGRYSWRGQNYHLPEELVGYDNTGNAIHGFVIDRPWRVVDEGPGFVTGEFQLSVDAPDRRPLWPADFTIRVRYELSGGTLRSVFQVINPDSVALPWGLGTHSYFKLPLANASQADRCLLTAPVTQQWDLNECLPSGEKTAIPADVTLAEGMYFGTRRFDDVLSGVPDDIVACSIIDEAAGLQITQRNPGSFRELVVYTPPNRDAVCFEPYTCVTDAINLQQQGVDAGWQVLGPGESFTTWIDIEAGPVLA